MLMGVFFVVLFNGNFAVGLALATQTYLRN
jgi:hypothetical protein